MRDDVATVRVIESEHDKQLPLFGNLTPTLSPEDLAETTGYLPGFEPPPSRLIPPPIVVFWDDVGSGSASPGRHGPARLDWRLFNEALLSVPPGEARGHQSVTLETTVRKLALGLWPPKREKSIKPRWHSHATAWPSLKNALTAMNRTVALIGPDDAWLPVLTRRFPPAGDMDGVVALEVRLPPGSLQGPLIHRPTLRKLGVKSARQYRSYLGLCWFWDRYLTGGGWMWSATQRRVERHESGALLVKGRALVERGRPVLRAPPR